MYIASNGNYSDVGLCGLPIKQFQAKYPGVDDGTVINVGIPNNTEIIAAAKTLIFN